MHSCCLRTILCILLQLPQQHNCVMLCSCEGHPGLRCLRPWEESVQPMWELEACDTSQNDLERLHCLHILRPRDIMCCTSKVMCMCSHNSLGRWRKDCSVLIARGKAGHEKGLLKFMSGSMEVPASGGIVYSTILGNHFRVVTVPRRQQCSDTREAFVQD